MVAAVETMFSVRQVPWHREGLVIPDYPGSWAAARELAGLDWEAIEETAYRLASIDGNGQPIFEPIEGFKQIVRSDTRATLSIRQDSYEIISNQAMGEIVEAVLDQPNVRWETAGVLEGGKAVWCLARLDEPIELPGDDTVTYPYLAITNRHDALGSCKLRATAIRIVCMNTFRAAELEGERTGATFSFRHSKKWRDRIEDARQAVNGARREIEEYKQLAVDLLAIKVTKKQRELFVREFIPAPPDGLASDRVMQNVEAAREVLRAILASPTTKGVASTAYGLVQAAGEYLDHARTAKTWETRLNRTLLRPEPLKAKALSLVREVVRA